ncbi:MAG: restriction endonuclease [Sphaerochaetaceae bacterium]
MQETSIKDNLLSSDVIENCIRTQMPHILEILLLDRTTSMPNKPQNIIWANDNYKVLDADSYSATAQISPELITGERGSLIMPRALKTIAVQKKRTKSKAEVFTPTWIVKKQNDAVDSDYAIDCLETYTCRKWLEITCGEAPYMATRYDMETGELIPLSERVGFIDRKLARISREVTDKAEWQRLVELAYKSSYGFEWNGDSLLIARENLLYTYRDYYLDKWSESPTYGLFENIAKIISYNVFQMDGLTYTIPLSEKKEQVQQHQLTLFDPDGSEQVEWIIVPGKRVRIMNWDTNKMEFFDKGIKRT